MDALKTKQAFWELRWLSLMKECGGEHIEEGQDAEAFRAFAKHYQQDFEKKFQTLMQKSQQKKSPLHSTSTVCS